MLRILETHRTIACAVINAIADLPLSQVLAMVDAGWQVDYGEEPRVAIDEPWLRRLTRGFTWLAGVLWTEAGEPVGFALLLQRTLYWHQQPWHAYYLTFLTVAPSHRRQGLGRWMLQCLHAFIVDTCGAEIMIAAFHPGHAGLPTVRQTCAQSPAWTFRPFHTASIWGRFLAGGPLAPLDASVSVVRVALPAGAASLTPVGAEGGVVLPPLPSAASFTAGLAAQYHVTFGPEASFRTRYLHPETPLAGTWWYHFGHAHEGHCYLSYEIVTVRANTRLLGLVGVIQGVAAQHCSPAHLSQAIQHLCAVCRTRGCGFVTVLDHGVMPHDVLRALGFSPTGGTRVFAVWGPTATVARLPAVHPPYLLDW